MKQKNPKKPKELEVKKVSPSASPSAKEAKAKEKAAKEAKAKEKADEKEKADAKLIESDKPNNQGEKLQPEKLQPKNQPPIEEPENGQPIDASLVENESLPPINPAWALNFAIEIRQEIKTVTGVGPSELHEQIYGADGVMKQLNSYRLRLPLDKLEEFDQVIALIQNDVKEKIGGYSPIDKTKLGGHAEEKAISITTPVVKPVAQDFEKKLGIEFGKIVEFIKKFKAERVCHAHHVHDFCKNNSSHGYEYSYDLSAKKLKGKFGGHTIEEDFEI